MRTRVARGLDRLRARLDAEHGDRRAWALAVLPWSRAAVPTVALAGALAVKKALVAVLVLLLGLLAWRYAPREYADRDALADPTIRAELAPALADLESPSVTVAARAPEGARHPAASGVRGPRPRRVFPTERGRGEVSGIVLDDVDAPLADVRVRALPHTGGLPPGLVVDDGRAPSVEVHSAADGTFHLAEIDEGPVRVEARFADGARAAAVVVVRAGARAGPVRLERSSARPDASTFHVLAVDPGGQPVAEARVEAYGWSRAVLDPAAHEVARDQALAQATTDADGRAQLDVSRFDQGVVFATAPDGRAGWAAVRHGHGPSRPLRIELAPGGRIRGELLGVRDEDVAGASIVLHALSESHPYYAGGGRRIAVALAGARFVVEGLAAGTYVVMLDASTGLRLDLPPHRFGEWDLPNSIEPATVVVEPGRTSELALRVMPGGTLCGRVVSGGEPVHGARVRAVLAPRTTNFPSAFVLHGVHVWRFDGDFENGPHSPVSHALTATDADGRYVFRGLHPGAYRVEVAFDGLALDRRLDVAVADGQIVVLEHDLAPAGVLQVAALEASYLGVTPAEVPPAGVPPADRTAAGGEVTPAGRARPVMIAVTADDIATFAGLAAGRYVISRFHSDAQVAPVPLGEAQVEAGRTTWIDLREAGLAARLRGVVRAGGEPVEGARIVLGRARAATDARGAFELRLVRPPRFGPAFGPALAIHHRGIEHQFTPTVDLTAADVPLELELGTQMLHLEVRDADGRAIAARAEIDWRPDRPDAGAPSQAFLRARGADGRFAIGPLAPGTLKGRIVLDDGWGVAVQSPLPRRDPLVVERPLTGSLRVRVLREGRAVADRSVNLSVRPDKVADGSSWSWRGTTDAEGLVVVDGPAGAVLVSVPAGFWQPFTTATTRVESGGLTELVVEIE